MLKLPLKLSRFHLQFNNMNKSVIARYSKNIFLLWFIKLKKFQGKYFRVKQQETAVKDENSKMVESKQIFPSSASSISSQSTVPGPSQAISFSQDAKRLKLEAEPKKEKIVVAQSEPILFDSDDDLFEAAEELERSITEDKEAMINSTQDAPASMGSKKIRKLFSSPKVRI